MKERRALLFEEQVCANGAFHFLLSHKAPLYDDFGYIIGLYGYCIDARTYQKMPDAFLRIYKKAEQTLLTLDQSHNPNTLTSLLKMIEHIEKTT